MAKLVFNNCCFCVDLRVGCYITGYLNLIVTAIATIVSVIVVAGGAVLTSMDDEDQKKAGIVVLVLGIITLLIFAVLLAFVFVLLIGLHKNKPGHVKAYIIYCYVFLLISLVMLIVNLAIGPYDISIASEVLALLFNTYCVLVIRSYYFQMLEESARPPQYNS